MKKRNLLAGILVGVMAMTALAGCGETTQSPQSSTSTTSSSSDFKADSDITVVSRENGSGTRRIHRAYGNRGKRCRRHKD